MDLGEFDTYLVVATKRTGSDSLNVDGIRVYNPLGTQDTIKDITEIADAYGKATGELGATVKDVRTMILGEGYAFEMGNAKNPVTAGGNIIASLAKMGADGKLYMTQGSTVVESYTGSIDSGAIAAQEAMDVADNTSSLLAYAISGPNNELYLTGEEYVFATALENPAEDATIQIGMKAVQGASKVEYLSNGTDENGYVWKTLADAEQITTATEMYYKVDLTDLRQTNDGKKVLVLRAVNAGAGDYILSMTNIKYNGVTFEKPAVSDLVADETVVKDEAIAGTFEVLSNSTGTRKSVVSFTVPNEVKEFTIIRWVEKKDEENQVVYDENGKPVLEKQEILTYSDSRGPVYKVDGVKISYKPAADSKVYVFQVTDKSLVGSYKAFTVATVEKEVETDNGTTTTVTASYAPAEFEVK